MRGIVTFQSTGVAVEQMLQLPACKQT